MTAPGLPDDVTIADIASTLDGTVDYVRGVFGNVIEFKKQHGAAFVRIGTTGRGIVPHYRIEPGQPAGVEDWMDDAYWTAFHGRNHKKLEWGLLRNRGATVYALVPESTAAITRSRRSWE